MAFSETANKGADPVLLFELLLSFYLVFLLQLLDSCNSLTPWPT